MIAFISLHTRETILSFKVEVWTGQFRFAAGHIPNDL